MSDAALDALATDIFDWYVRWNPVFATQMGIHEFDHLLPRGTREAQFEELAKAKEALDRLAEIEPKSLSPGKRVDHGVLRHVLRLAAFEIEELRIWEGMPQGAESVGDALFPLFLRDFAPLPTRLESIASRLEAAPRHLEEMRGRVRYPVRIWAEIGLESAQRFPGFLRIIEATGKTALPSEGARRLSEAAAKTSEAMAAYAKWIETEVRPRAKDRVGVGATKFRKLIRLRELGLSVEAIYAIGEKYLRESKRELSRLAAEIRPGASVEEAKEIVKGDHPATFAAALEYTAEAMADAKRFVVENALATIPPNEDLKVIETPEYIRHVFPFAAYSSPARFEVRKQGLYMVTPVEDKPERLREHAYAHTRNTAVHEGYPGHHLQLTCANLNPSRARALCWAVEAIEGWAHYCEDMMKEAGFLADPRTRFAQTIDQVWRACRILIDVDLHFRRMTFDEAVGLLVREAGMERTGAIAEVRRYTYHPAYQLSYLLGKHLILELRDEVRKGMGAAYTAQFFHDTYLYAGSLPMRYMRQIFSHKVRELRWIRARGG